MVKKNEKKQTENYDELPLFREKAEGTVASKSMPSASASKPPAKTRKSGGVKRKLTAEERKEKQREMTRAFHEEQRAYERRKKWAYEYERDNDSTIMIFKSKGDGWWKMGGNSVLFYYYKVAPRLNLTLKVAVDQDFQFKFPAGILSVRNLDVLEERLAQVAIKKDVKNSNDEFMFFNLGYKVTKEDIDGLRRTDELKLKKLNAVLEPEVIAPEINTNLENAMRTLYNKTQKMSVIDRDFVGMEMTKRTRALMENYRLMAVGSIDMATGFTRIIKGIDLLLIDLAIVGELSIIDLDSCLRISTNLLTVRRIVNKRLNGIEDPEHEMAGDEMREKFGMSPRKNQ